MGIERDGADGSVAESGIVRGGGLPGLVLGVKLLAAFLPLLAALRRIEVGVVDALDAHGCGELFRAVAHEQDVRRVLHDATGEGDGVLDGLHAGDRAAAEGGAVHDGGVELVRAVVGEDRALAGVEERVFFEGLDDFLHGVKWLTRRGRVHRSRCVGAAAASGACVRLAALGGCGAFLSMTPAPPWMAIAQVGCGLERVVGQCAQPRRSKATRGRWGAGSGRNSRM